MLLHQILAACTERSGTVLASLLLNPVLNLRGFGVLRFQLPILQLGHIATLLRPAPTQNSNVPPAAGAASALPTGAPSQCMAGTPFRPHKRVMQAVRHAKAAAGPQACSGHP